MTVFEKQKNIKAASVTIGVHILLLSLFLLIRYQVPAMEPTPEMGMEVNLGNSTDGMGDEQPLIEGNAGGDAVSVHKATAGNNTPSARNYVSTDDDRAPGVTPSTEKNKRQGQDLTNNRSRNQQTNVTTNNQQTQRAKALYTGEQNGNGGNNATSSNRSTGEGITGKPGDQGQPDGNPDATNYTGGGTGSSGVSHSLENRSIIAYPPKDAEFRQGGNVLLRVTVDRTGNIIRYRVVSAGNAQIRALAEQKIKKVRFNPNDEAPAEQSGNITFKFVVTR